MGNLADKIEREIFPEIAKHLKKQEITLITGARQVGKTVLLNQLEKWLVEKQRVNSKNIYYFNLDIAKDWEFFQSQSSLIEFIKERSQINKIYMLIDEAQKAPNSARFFKGIYDSNLNAKLVLTGSSSLEIKNKIQESLAGRKKVFYVSSFSFAEFLKFKDEKLLENFKNNRQNLSKISKEKLLSFYKEYIIWGGYPRVVLSKSIQEKVDVLADIYSSYIEKDIVGLMEIKNRLGFSNLVKLLAGQIGQLVNVNELSSLLNLDRDTVERYIQILKETFIISPLPPYYKNSRQEIIKQNKIYFNDTGIRNYSVEDFSDLNNRNDKGQLLENTAFRGLRDSLKLFQKIRFWRSKSGAEADFILIKKDDLVPIEIKSNKKDLDIPSGLRSFIEKYSPKKAFVANLAVEGKNKIGKTDIEFIYPFDL